MNWEEAGRPSSSRLFCTLCSGPGSHPGSGAWAWWEVLDASRGMPQSSECWQGPLSPIWPALSRLARFLLRAHIVLVLQSLGSAPRQGFRSPSVVVREALTFKDFIYHIAGGIWAYSFSPFFIYEFLGSRKQTEGAEHPLSFLRCLVLFTLEELNSAGSLLDTEK